MRAVVAAIVVGAVATPAAAQPSMTAPDQTVIAAPPRRDRAVSIGLWSLAGLATLAAQYEQQHVRRRWSWIAGGGIRRGAGGDYHSTTLAAGGEIRYWLRGQAVWADLPPRSIAGWFAGARMDLAWTRTVDDARDRTAGNNLAIAVTGSFGYRFVIRRRVELATWVALGATREADLGGRLPAYWRPSPRLGTSLGWMF